MAELFPQLDALQRVNDFLKQEEAAEKELLEQVRVHSRSFCLSSSERRCLLLLQLVKADQVNNEAIARLQEEAKTLRSALTAHAKRALPATPTTSLSAPFMEAIKRSIITQVQEHVLPIVAQTRTEIREDSGYGALRKAEGQA